MIVVTRFAETLRLVSTAHLVAVGFHMLDGNDVAGKWCGLVCIVVGTVLGPV